MKNLNENLPSMEEESNKMVLNLQDLMKAAVTANDEDNDDIGYEKDIDTCTNEELEKLFQTVYTRFTKLKISSDSYCTEVRSDSNFDNIAVSLSKCEINVVDANSMKKVLEFKPHNKQITGCRFSPQNKNLIYTSSGEGVIKLFDIRSNKSEKEFKEDLKDTKPFSSFDISLNDRILCAGTELIDEDAFLLFWDIRGTKLLGGYWESHSDEVTCVKFNDTNPNIMASGSIDGLINIFDVSKDSEDNAFTYCLNTGGTVNAIKWETGDKNLKFLFSVADASKLDYWNIEESVPSKHFSESDIVKCLKRKLPEESYVVSIFGSKNSNPVILIGSGMEEGDNISLRSLIYDRETKTLKPAARFNLRDGESKLSPVVRSSLYNEEVDRYITAAEDGSLTVWSQSDDDTKRESKIGSKKSKSHRIKPY